MNFGKILCEIRKNRHISQEVLAEKVGVSRQAVAKWEANESLPDIPKLISLADYFDVSVDFLLGREQTNYDKIMMFIGNIGQNSRNEYDGEELLPLLNRYMNYMEKIGCTSKQIVDGISEICYDKNNVD